MRAGSLIGRLDLRHRLQFLRFCVVGGVGFAVDAGVLLLAVRLFGIDPIEARLVSFAAAVVATFELNRRWAFKDGHARPYWPALSSYLGVQGVGFVCNFGIYTLLYLTLPKPYDLPLLCLAVASAVALVLNYAGASLIVFRASAGSKRV